MRSLYRKTDKANLEQELNIVQSVMYSTVFILLDLLLISFILTMMIYPLHHSIRYALLTLISFLFIGLSALFVLSKWLDQQVD